MGPFLLTHRIAGTKHLFDISSKLYPLSIRDQMIRGFLLIEEAIAADLIGPTKPLLVIGAGAAGATAALLAAQRGVPTTLLEKSDEPFTRQFNCDTRIVSPTVYDWPADHWVNTKFPWTGVSFPLEWHEDFAGAIATAWRSRLKLEARRRDRIKIKFLRTLADAENFKTVSPSPTDGLIEVHLKMPRDEVVPDKDWDTNPAAWKIDPESPQRFAVIISCIGLGRERSSVGENGYRGLDFWAPDKLSHSDFGVHGTHHPNILISGGGDGALQDFLRIVTVHDSPREIMAALPDRVKEALALGIKTAEDQAVRSFIWNTTRYDCRSQYKLHKSYQAVVKRIIGEEYQSVSVALAEMIRAVPRVATVRLVHPCQHFSPCYALNRALVLLIAEYVRLEHNVDLITPFTSVTDVVSLDGHVCDVNIKECRESSHRVTFELARCEDMSNAGRGSGDGPHTPPFDVIVIRHGIKFPPYLFGASPDSNSRHLLPYYIDADWY